ncbi:MAG: hypothetical protein DI565_12845 [Ancylobacter novellus]|uniref:Uncharacterized protein n=1 Tax=Ancylobacter novellus TaxID=921 RepID=A0A2W5KBR8_ANCNO|nr:MAG: hypothetical protein DI565_12845 [Ancylobacter novellus]
MADAPKHPAHGWGSYADDPWSEGLEGAGGRDCPAWVAPVDEARRLRLALQPGCIDENDSAGEAGPE